MKKKHILLSLSACIAFGATVLAQAPATGGTQTPIAGGATGSGTTGISGGGGRRFTRTPVDPITVARTAEIRKVLDKVTPVTSEQLHNPSPDDWLMWRRTYDA